MCNALPQEYWGVPVCDESYLHYEFDTIRVLPNCEIVANVIVGTMRVLHSSLVSINHIWEWYMIHGLTLLSVLNVVAYFMLFVHLLIIVFGVMLFLIMNQCLPLRFLTIWLRFACFTLLLGVFVHINLY